MKYLDFGIAVNVFWKELNPYLHDRKDPYGNKDLLPAQQAFASVDKAIANLSKLPPSYKEFYCLRLIAHIRKKMELYARCLPCLKSTETEKKETKDYPVDLNPFENETEENREWGNEYPEDMNPFGSAEDEENK
ncbi:hypothetical protein JTE90_009835, partial [Oedothorax gibbosus]